MPRNIVHDHNPLYVKIVEVSKKNKTLPFSKCIEIFKETMESTKLSPLEKLAKL